MSRGAEGTQGPGQTRCQLGQRGGGPPRVRVSTVRGDMCCLRWPGRGQSGGSLAPSRLDSCKPLKGRFPGHSSPARGAARGTSCRRCALSLCGSAFRPEAVRWLPAERPSRLVSGVLGNARAQARGSCCVCVLAEARTGPPLPSGASPHLCPCLSSRPRLQRGPGTPPDPRPSGASPVLCILQAAGAPVPEFIVNMGLRFYYLVALVFHVEICRGSKSRPTCLTVSTCL